MKKKVKSDREKVIRRVLIAPGTLMAQGFIYPFVGWLASKDGYSSPSQCEVVIPLDLSMEIYTVLFLVLVGMMIPILTGRTKSAIYFMLYGVVALLLIGGWFAALGLLTMFCQSLPYAHEMVEPMMISFVVGSIVILVFNRRRMQKVLAINGHVYDFKSMRYSQLALHTRLDGRNSGSVGFMIYLASFVGIFLANIPFGDLLNTGESSKDWFLVIACWMVGFAYIGYLALNQLYLVWLIYMKSKNMGDTMLVKELLPVEK